MNKVTKNKPNDDGCRGNAVMVGLCRKNQDEEKGREEGKNGELDAHGAGEFLTEPTLRTECKGSMRAFITRIKVGYQVPHVKTSRSSSSDGPKQQASYQMKNKAREG